MTDRDKPDTDKSDTDDTDDTERRDENFKLPPEEDREYGPYGQQRPGRRPDVTEDDVANDKREEAWQRKK